MGDLSLDERITRRIRESLQYYSPEVQLAELLLRNQRFLEERERVGIPLYIRPAGTGFGLIEHSSDWQDFVYRWGINGSWDGRDTTLWRNISVEPRIYFRDPESGIVWNAGKDPSKPSAGDQRLEKGALNIATEGGFIYIRINPWTLKKDLLQLEPTIRKLRRDVFRYTARTTKTFGRNLCWYDLHKNSRFEKLSYSEIEIEFRKFRPRQGVQPRKRIIAGVRRIDIQINRLTPKSARFSPRP